MAIYFGCGIYIPEMGETQYIGLLPDIEVYPTVEGIKEGCNELMEAAIEYLKNKFVFLRDFPLESL